MKTGGKSPYFSPVGGANEAAHILSLMGGRAAIQGRNPAETNAFQNRGKEVSNMAVFRIEKTRDYTVMSNHHLRDKSLSLKEKGLLSLMLSLPEEPEQGNPAQLNTNRSSKEKSKKYLSSTEGSNPVLSTPKAPRGSDGMGRDWMRERESYRELILENIEYDYLIQNHQLDRDRLDELVELMVDTVCSRRETIRIAGDDYPAEVVKSRFLKLDSSHI